MNEPLSVPARRDDAQVTLDYLLQRLRHRTDFPALSTSVARIQSLSASESGSLSMLCDEILQDVALTNKLLRLVNSAACRRAGEDPISTVSRAVGLLGVSAIRALALSLTLVEHMKDKHHARQIKEVFLRAVMAGAIARELCSTEAEGEEAFVAALFRHLGSLLVAFYLPEEGQEIRQAVAGRPGQAALTPVAAERQVLGLEVQTLGLAVGRSWTLPAALIHVMALDAGQRPQRSLAARPDWSAWLVLMASEAAEVMVSHEPAEMGDALKAMVRPWQRSLEVRADELLEAVLRARQRLSDWLAVMDLALDDGEDSPTGRLLGSFYVDAPNAGDAGPDAAALGLVEPQEDGSLMRSGGHAAQDAASMLSHGIQDVSQTLMGEFKLPDVIQMVLETMLRGLKAQRVVFCLRDARSGQMVGRHALGADAELVRQAFSFPVTSGLAVSTPGDLFAGVCQRGVDTLIADARQPSVLPRLPAWFRQKVKAPCFLLLPLMVRHQGRDVSLGLLYADHAEPEGIQIGQQELALLRTLRNQAVLAFRQSASGVVG